MDFQKIRGWGKKKWIWIILGILILVLAFCLYLFPIRIAHWWDETVYLQNAETLFFGATNYNELSFRPPLISIIFGLGFLIWHSTIFASIIEAALATLAPIFFFLIGKKLYGSKTGIVAALMIGFSPFVIQNANYLMTDVPVISLMAISFYLAIFRERKWTLFLSGIFLALATLMKFDAVLLVPILLLYLAINKTKFRNFLFFCAGALIPMIPYLIIMQISYGSFLEPFIKGNSFVQGATENSWFYFKNAFVAFTPLASLGFLIFLGYSIKDFIKKKIIPKKEELIFLLWITIVLIFLIHTPHKELRYILPIGVPFILLAARGLFYIPQRIFKKNAKVASIVMICIIFVFLLAAAFVYHANYEGNQIINNSKSADMIASSYLVNNLKYNGSLHFFVNDNWPVFAYYTGLNVSLLPWGSAEEFYSGYFSFLKTGEVLIVDNQTEGDPKVSWMNNNSNFKLMGQSGRYYFYEYQD